MARLHDQTALAIQVEAINGDVSPGSLARRIADRPGLCVLESTAVDSAHGRYSILAADPISVIQGSVEQRPIDRFLAALRSLPCHKTDPRVPFVGGWIGYIGYEAGLAAEGIVPADDHASSIPALRMALYDTAAVYDHIDRQWYLVGVDCPRAAGWNERAATARRAWLRERVAWPGDCDDPVARFRDAACDRPAANMSRAEYLDRVRRALDYIAAGDVYQVNLSQRFHAQTHEQPIDLFDRLRVANPANFAAMLQWGDCAVVSASPELFLALDDDLVVTRPIKGTAPRTGDNLLDAVRRDALMHSEKDAAELAMIVDLLRNDLGRVCSYGTVRVLEPCRIEDHPTVFHRVATIEGRLRSGFDVGDLLRAAFPGGSITGAPKIRAMQIIAELEPCRRHAYCGSIGYVGLDGRSCFNIAIRTMMHQGEHIWWHAGGGIVADSDPDAEYDECLAKAAGIVRALGWEGHRENAGAESRTANPILHGE